MRHRLAIRYAITGDLRFLSHQDTLRLFQRAFARAGVAIRYSEGFNPRPRISLAMPRPVGVESCDELLVIELTSPADPDVVLTHLQAQLPTGITLKSAVQLAMQDRCMPISAEYAMPVDVAMTTSLQRAAGDLMAKTRHVVDRKTTDGQRKKSVDIRAFLREIRLDDGLLIWSQTVCVDGTARVGEVLEAVGLPAADWTHRVVRRKANFRD